MDIPLDKFISLTIAAVFEAKDRSGFISSRVEFDLAVTVSIENDSAELLVVDSPNLPHANRIRFGLDVVGL